MTIGRLHLLKQNALQNLIAYFATSWAAILQHLLTQPKLQFKKKLQRSSILLIIVAMDQSGYNSDMVKASKKDSASPSMIICCHFSLRASWIAQSIAAASNQTYLQVTVGPAPMRQLHTPPSFAGNSWWTHQRARELHPRLREVPKQEPQLGFQLFYLLGFGMTWLV